MKPKVQRAKPTRPAIADEAGAAWQAAADAAWIEAGGDIALYVAPPFPAWERPEHVTRDLYGRFLLDRERGILHDVASSTPECGIDAIGQGTFVHFAHELERDPATVAAARCPRCLGA